MHSLPSGYTFGWNGIGERNLRAGGEVGKSCVKDSRARKNPPGTFRHQPRHHCKRSYVCIAGPGVWHVRHRLGARGRHGGSLTTVVLDVVINHEHDLPLEDVVVDQAARYALHVLRCCALGDIFEVAAEE